MDPLSDVLSLLKPRSLMFGGFDVGGDWSIRFPSHAGINCYAVISGHCWVAVDGGPPAVRLEAGDCALLPPGPPFRLAGALDVPPDDLKTIITAPLNGGVRTWNGGGACSGVGGYFDLDGSHAGELLGMLPPVMQIERESDRRALRWSMEGIMQELREPEPGGVLVLQHLAQVMLVQALRAHLAAGARGAVGWLSALADPQIGAAIRAMHADPGHRWTLGELAGRVGLSRSTFALKFKQTVGASPLDYLIRWRMLLAADRLAHSNDGIATIALTFGYESESAFSTAFKRVMGCSPRRYSRGSSLASSIDI